MKRFFLCLESFPRKFPCGVRARNIGFVPDRTAWNDWSHAVRHDVDISFFMRGKGTLLSGARQWRIDAPCALVKPPSRPIRYGPDTEWDEFYVDFALSQQPALRRLDLLRGEPVRPLAHPELIGHLMCRIDEARERVHETGGADRLDRLCEQLVFEAALPASRQAEAGPQDRAVQAVRADLECHAGDAAHPDEVARRHGLSPATFRRLWNRNYPDISPARFMMHVRMDQACRLLSDTNMPIKAVAARLGFADPCYFMKVFHRHTGLTAAGFRAARRRAAPGRPARGVRTVG